LKSFTRIVGARLREVVEHVVAVPAGAAEPDLHEPRPNLFGARGDRDRAREVEVGLLADLVAGQRSIDLFRRCSPLQVPAPVERGQQAHDC
jgi:hypothetical protein